MPTQIDDFPCKPLPARTQAAMKRGERQRYALATTTRPVATVKVG